mmetsp:Transcript_11016/g.29404  ORF Transcript_11016/g.29404 Transcript_11016/m.29404 type:complete len:288 (+) Transcript_11016:204-1067(+)
MRRAHTSCTGVARRHIRKVMKGSPGTTSFMSMVMQWGKHGRTQQMITIQEVRSTAGRRPCGSPSLLELSEAARAAAPDGSRTTSCPLDFRAAMRSRAPAACGLYVALRNLPWMTTSVTPVCFARNSAAASGLPSATRQMFVWPPSTGPVSTAASSMREASKPMSSTSSQKSLGLVLLELRYHTTAFSLMRSTSQRTTSCSFPRARSTALLQFEQVMPPTFKVAHRSITTCWSAALASLGVLGELIGLCVGAAPLLLAKGSLESGSRGSLLSSGACSAREGSCRAMTK